MKSIIVAGLFCTLCILLYVSDLKPPPQEVHRPLERGEVNSGLKQIGHDAPVSIGARVYFRHDYTSAGRILDVSEAYEFEPRKSLEPSLLIEWNGGKREWIPRRRLEKAWVENER